MTDKTRVLIIGIDAATLDLIQPWAEEGRLPVFARLLKEGSFGPLRSVPNCNSAPAWTSMVTGKNPGKHGILFFTQPKKHSLEFEYTNGSYRRTPALWNMLGKAGKRVGVMNVPMTYPAEAVNGFMISGIDAPGVHDPRFIYPPELHSELQGSIGEYVIEAHLGSYLKAGKLSEGAEALYHNIERRLAASRHLMTKHDWDFFMVVFRTTDPAQHYFWKYMDPSGFQVSQQEVARFGGVIPTVYQMIDDAVGELLEIAGPDTVSLIVSDHGASADTGKAKVLTEWLKALGLLSQIENGSIGGGWKSGFRGVAWRGLAKGYHLADRLLNWRLKKRLAEMFPALRTRAEGFLVYHDMDWSRTKAFTDGARAEVWINLKGREPFGIVEPGDEYENLCEWTRERLLAARDADSGKPIVQAVYRRDEVYNGPYSEMSPDLIIHWEKNTTPKRIDVGNGKIIALEGYKGTNPLDRMYCGTHDPMGILFMTGGPVRKGFQLEGARIEDIAPTVLHLLGEAVPDDLDGRVLAEALEGEYLMEHQLRRSARSEEGEAVPAGYTEEDEGIIEERLRGLGYIE